MHIVGMNQRLIRIVIAGMAILDCGPAFADAIVVSKAMDASTIAEIFIEEDAIRVELEIGVRPRRCCSCPVATSAFFRRISPLAGSIAGS